jgi:hypothetical protein
MLGANLILQRLMVQRNMPEKVTLLSLDSSSELCQNVYVNTGLFLYIVLFIFQ